MPPRRATPRQLELFRVVSRCGPLVLAQGSPAARVNVVGTFRIARHGAEDRLDADDGANHVHVDWSAVDAAEVGVCDGEGTIRFRSGTAELFVLFRPAGPFPPELAALAKDLLGAEPPRGRSAAPAASEPPGPA